MSGTPFPSLNSLPAISRLFSLVPMGLQQLTFGLLKTIFQTFMHKNAQYSLEGVALAIMLH